MTMATHLFNLSQIKSAKLKLDACFANGKQLYSASSSKSMGKVKVLGRLKCKVEGDQTSKSAS